MKTFTLLAVTGGLFFTSLCLNSKHVKKAEVWSKCNAKHCIKKGCDNAKKGRIGGVNTNGKAACGRG